MKPSSKEMLCNHLYGVELQSSLIRGGRLLHGRISRLGHDHVIFRGRDDTVANGEDEVADEGDDGNGDSSATPESKYEGNVVGKHGTTTEGQTVLTEGRVDKLVANDSSPQEANSTSNSVQRGHSVRLVFAESFAQEELCDDDGEQVGEDGDDHGTANGNVTRCRGNGDEANKNSVS